ncbi:MAG: ribosomal L7Ae/L30e/S12e/Gadd45 family protein [Candidatus Woesearchaeota archaeon]
MAKKKEIDKNIEEIKKYIDTNKAVLGSIVTLKKLKRGSLAKIFLSANVPISIKEDINYYNKISDVKIVELSYPNNELGALCKKPFSISIIGILK